MTPKEVYAGLALAEREIKTNPQTKQATTALEAIRTAMRHLEPFSK